MLRLTVLISVATTNCRNYVSGAGDGKRIGDALASCTEGCRVWLSQGEG